MDKVDRANKNSERCNDVGRDKFPDSWLKGVDTKKFKGPILIKIKIFLFVTYTII